MNLKRVDLKHPVKIGGREHFPRPDFVRTPSYILDGEWSLCPDPGKVGTMKGWHTKDYALTVMCGDNAGLRGADAPLPVAVPFPLESDINQRRIASYGLTPERIAKIRRFWYFKKFSRPEGLHSGLLRFGAVDYRASVWLNGEYLGTHEGGYTPFSFPVQKFDDENVLAVLVEDSASLSQVRGKQTFLKKPFLVWYPGCTGIWQPVWIEPVSRIYIQAVCYQRDRKGNMVLRVDVQGLHTTTLQNVSATCKIFASQIYGKKRGILKTPIRELAQFTTLSSAKKGSLEFILPEKIFTRWSPEWPSLHPIQISLSHNDNALDTVHLLFGCRSLEVDRGIIKLNKKKLYQRLLLNQGYYPGGLYTPEDPDQYKHDIELMLASGFNGCRMHQKIENPVFHYWADLLGFILWQEMPSYYLPSKKNMLRLESQLHEVTERDCFHPSILMLVLYNESWGLYDMFVLRSARKRLAELYGRCKTMYPDMLIIDNSGFHHVKTDIADIHHYIPSFDDVDQFYSILSGGVREAPFWYNFFRMIMGKGNVQTPFLKDHGEKDSPLIISEFGGYGFGLYEHDDISLERFFQKHLELMAKYPALQGWCYTQFTDTLQEKNGLFTMERVPKFEKIRDSIIKFSVSSKKGV